ncbi:MAG: type I methionyl aminopeptidase [Bacteroidia bacterium]|nr:type I methionyl aminopeptidase [Bacteroidia bacterium]MCX7652694.1 type I methionyl aminopeptidase [Bacteroidia bacterium]MDW8416422.1 type I methionyl aminopeptidase [Bacteroidia bacterium]
MKYEGWPIYSEEQIKIIAAASDILSRMFGYLASYIVPGITTAELDDIAEEFIRREGAEPAFKGYQPPFEDTSYPYTLCVSINEEIVHGLPSSSRYLQEGQIVSIDCGVRLKGFHADMAYTFPVGNISPQAYKLLKVTEEALYRGISQAKVGAYTGDIGHSIFEYVKSYNFAVSEQLTGHGVGEAMHMPPDIPNVGKPGKGFRLPDNLVIAIEPMVQMGSRRVRRGPDGWAVCTRDGSLAAHFEHTVVVRRGQAQILTSFEPIKKSLVHV